MASQQRFAASKRKGCSRVQRMNDLTPAPANYNLDQQVIIKLTERVLQRIFANRCNRHVRPATAGSAVQLADIPHPTHFPSC